MPKIKKRVQFQNLSKVRTWIVDDSPFSDYFRLAQIPEILSGGKSGFLINGSPNLVRTTEVLLELTDVDGNVIFTQPIKNYQEGLARVISIEVYEDTPPGPAVLTILGEVAFDKFGNRVPDEWIGTYNVKWQKIINIEPTRPNINPIRLYNRPELTVTEQLIPFRQVASSSIIYVSTGSITGQYVSPTIQLVGDDITNLQRQVTTDGTVINSTNPIFVRPMVDGIFYAVVNGLPFTSSFDKLQSATSAKLSTYVTNSDGSVLNRWTTNQYTISYQSSPTFITSSLNRSFANIKLSNLTTFTGDIQRAKFYVRGTDEGSKYELLEDIVLEAVELTVSQSSTGEQVELGQIIDQPFLNQNWQSGLIANGTVYTTGNVTASYNSTTLIDSVTLTGPGTGSLYTTGSSKPSMWMGITQPLPIDELVEYTIQADIVCLKSSTYDARMDICLSGSVFCAGQGNDLGYLITSLIVPTGQTRRTFQNFVFNFTAPATDITKLRFNIYGGQWFVSNVKLVSARESGFNPDQISVFSSIINRRFELLQFKAELYDANSNLVPLLIETDPIYFDGGNLVFRGTDTRIDGLLTIAPSGSGITMGNITSGSFLGISANGIATPISQSILATYTGSPQISLYSGTYFNVPQIGFQLVGFSGSEVSYLDFNTSTGKLTIRGDLEILPNSPLSTSIYSGTLTYDEIVRLANGIRPGGTFINATSINSPTIIGQNGYISQKFGVGDITSNRGIILSALGYTSSMSVPVPNVPAIYIGQGTEFNANTPFLVASGSSGSVLSLGDKLHFEPSGSGSTMTIRGKIYVQDPVTGQIGEFNDVRKVIANRMAFGPFGFYISNL